MHKIGGFLYSPDLSSRRACMGYMIQSFHRFRLNAPVCDMVQLATRII